MPCGFWLADWLVGWLVDWMAGWLVGNCYKLFIHVRAGCRWVDNPVLIVQRDTFANFFHDSEVGGWVGWVSERVSE